MHKDRKSNRLQGYDYSRNALYFVTSCVHDRVCDFGEIKEGQMFPNEYGKIAEQQWQWLEQQYPYLVLHSFVVMPNHIHGIIEIDDRMVGAGRDLSNENDDRNVGTGPDLPLRQKHEKQPNNSNGNPVIPEQQFTKIKSLSELMGAYKTTTSKQIHLFGLQDFKWQRSFHEHIIRNEESYLRISNYIQNNPSNWKDDKFYT